MTEIPTTPQNVTMNAEIRNCDEGSVSINISWQRPQNFDQFDIDHYAINVTSTSGAQHMTTACGECTSTVITVSENLNNVGMETTFTATIAAVNLCGETGVVANTSNTFRKCFNATCC